MDNFSEIQSKHQKILGATDEELTIILNQLPNKRLYEFGYHKLFNDKDAEFDSWIDWDEWTYPVQDLLRFHAIILDNIKHIKGKRIIDLASHIGYLSLFSLHIGAKHAICTNIEAESRYIVREVLLAAGYSVEQFQAVIADLHDYKTTTKLCATCDTVIISGVLYHVHDHYQILESICAAGPATIIIETSESNNILDNPMPLIEWHTEDGTSDTKGFYNSMNNILVGHPNASWFKLTMDTLGYDLEKQPTRFCMLASATCKSKDDVRSVQVFTRRPSY